MNDPSFSKSFALPGLLVPKTGAEEGPAHGVGDLVDALRRHRLGLAVWLLVCLGGAAAYLATTPAQYVASTLVFLEPARPPVGAVEADGGVYQNNLDAARADSQMQIVKSERLLRFVFDTLKLADTPEFAPGPPGMRQRFVEMFVPAQPPTKEQLARGAFLSFMGRVGVRRIGISYVLEIAYTASTPSLAASTVDSITSAYILDEVGAARRGGEYMQDRISALNAEEAAALQAVKTGTISDMRFPDSDARVISAAITPTGKASPQTGLVCAFALCLGLISGFGVVFARHSVDGRIRNRRQLPPSAATLSVLPALSRRDQRRWLRRIVPSPEACAGPFLDALRSALPCVLGGNAGDRRLVIGITSWRSGEGKSTVALSLASLLAAADENVVLVDAMMRDPVLSQALVPAATVGLNEVLSRRTPSTRPDCFRITDRMQFVPAVGRGRAPDGNVFFGSLEMRRQLSDLRDRGTVIVDLPALSLSSDTMAIGALLDGLIVVVEANAITFRQLQDALSALRAADYTVLGIILNKAKR